MKIEFTMPDGLEEQLKSIVIQATEEAIQEFYEKLATKEWLSIAEAKDYLGVSHNTLRQFRVIGLPVCEIGGVKRINKKEIDDFMKKNSF